MKTTLYEGKTGQKYLLRETRSDREKPSFTIYRLLSEAEYGRYVKSCRDEIYLDSLEQGHWLRFYVTWFPDRAVSHLVSVVGQDGYNSGVPYGDFAPVFFPVIYSNCEDVAAADDPQEEVR